MAKLHPDPYPGDWRYKSGDDLTDYNTRTDRLFREIPPHRVISFPHADGYAFYFVYSEKPLVLQHIPYGDAWRIDPAYIRGLRLVDIRKHIVHQVMAGPLTPMVPKRP